MSTPLNAIAIARAAGVSRTAVSYVIHGKADRYGIATKTQERVRATIRQLGCAPDLTIRNMYRGACPGLNLDTLRRMDIAQFTAILGPVLAENGYRIVPIAQSAPTPAEPLAQSPLPVPEATAATDSCAPQPPPESVPEAAEPPAAEPAVAAEPIEPADTVTDSQVAQPVEPMESAPDSDKPPEQAVPAEPAKVEAAETAPVVALEPAPFAPAQPDEEPDVQRTETTVEPPQEETEPPDPPLPQPASPPSVVQPAATVTEPMHTGAGSDAAAPPAAAPMPVEPPGQVPMIETVPVEAAKSSPPEAAIESGLPGLHLAQRHQSA